MRLSCGFNVVSRSSGQDKKEDWIEDRRWENRILN